jgi:hypothetical protein
VFALLAKWSGTFIRTILLVADEPEIPMSLGAVRSAPSMAGNAVDGVVRAYELLPREDCFRQYRKLARSTDVADTAFLA